MRKLWIVAAAVLVVAPVRADEAAEKVLKKAVEAHGGEKVLLEKKAGEMTMKMNVKLGDLDIPLTGEMVYSLPDKYKLTITGELGGEKLKVIQSVNGDKVKETQNGMEQKVEGKRKAELLDSVRHQEIGLIAPLLNANRYTLKAEKDAKVGDSEAAVVQVTSKGMKDVKLFFDKETGLLIRMERMGLAPGTEEEVPEVTDFSDYKKVDGIQTPMSMKVLSDGKLFLTAKVTQTKYYDKLDDKKFVHDD
jgi:hypothetical protein